MGAARSGRLEQDPNGSSERGFATISVLIVTYIFGLCFFFILSAGVGSGSREWCDPGPTPASAQDARPHACWGGFQGAGFGGTPAPPQPLLSLSSAADPATPASAAAQQQQSNSRATAVQHTTSPWFGVPAPSGRWRRAPASSSEYSRHRCKAEADRGRFDPAPLPDHGTAGSCAAAAHWVCAHRVFGIPPRAPRSPCRSGGDPLQSGRTGSATPVVEHDPPDH